MAASAGPDARTFAPVQITGSHNAVLARIDTTDSMPGSGDRVRPATLTSSPGPPIQRLVFTLDGHARLWPRRFQRLERISPGPCSFVALHQISLVILK